MLLLSKQLSCNSVGEFYTVFFYLTWIKKQDKTKLSNSSMQTKEIGYSLIMN